MRQWLAFLAGLRSNRKLNVGLAIVLGLLCLSLVGGLFWDTDQARLGSAPLELSPGSAGHPLGTDGDGRDMLALLLKGTPHTLEIGLIVGLLGTAIGIVLGFLGGFLGGWVDGGIRVLSDAALTIPPLAILVVIAAFVPQLDVVAMALIVATLSWAWPTRVLRSQVLSLKQSGFVRTARLSGASSHEIMFREMMPNVAPYLAATFVATASYGILAALGLEALGLGPQRIPTLGMTLYFAVQDSAILRGLWWWWAMPTAMLMLIFAGLYLISIGLDELTNPRLQGRGAIRDARRMLLGARRTDAEPLPSAPADEGVLSINDLRVEYPISPERVVVACSGVSLAVGEAETLGLVGESGSGKTTVGMASLGLLPPPGRVAGGTVMLGDTELLRLDAEGLRCVRGTQIALIPQGSMSALNPVMRIERQFEDLLAAHGHTDDVGARIGELLDSVGLPARVARRYPHELSGGMRQRVCIALAVALNPSMIIADEPTSALDVVVQREIAEVLRDIKRRFGVSMLLIGHDMGLQAQLADRVAVMHRGTIVETQGVGELFSRPEHEYTRRLIEATPALAVAR
jgi:ABC-type dipeptide/oligopeptide/nickel transport system ATPase component/ABC-type dipeptide/oligopeptide/nickel transport system permease subunit